MKDIGHGLYIPLILDPLDHGCRGCRALHGGKAFPAKGTHRVGGTVISPGDYHQLAIVQSLQRDREGGTNLNGARITHSFAGFKITARIVLPDLQAVKLIRLGGGQRVFYGSLGLGRGLQPHIETGAGTNALPRFRTGRAAGKRCGIHLVGDTHAERYLHRLALTRRWAG